EQRLQAVLRILGTDSAGDDSGAGSGSGEAGDGQITILDLDVLLGEAAQADVLATLGGTQEEDALAEVQANALLGQALADAGIAPEAVVAVRLGRNGLVRVLVNSESQVADGGGTAGGDTPATGSGGGDDTGAPPSTGDDTGNNGDNSTGGASSDGSVGSGDTASTDGSDTDTNDNDSTGEEGTAAGDAGDADAGTGELADATVGQPGANPAAGAAAGAVLTADVQAIALPIQKVSCSAAAAAIATGDPAEASDILSAGPSDVSVVQLDGCGTATVPMTAGPAVQTALASNPVLGDVLAQNGVAVTQVVSVTAADDRLTVFVAEPN
ncbi:MAG: hypothetical protein JWR39_2595, partial [Devosia sp.]|nr:hypothetical protein [Devosia sp.]